MTHPCSLQVGYSAVTSFIEEGHEGGGGGRSISQSQLIIILDLPLSYL